MLLIILFAPSFPSLYKSSVLPVSLSSLNVISVCSCLPRSLFCVPNKVFQRKFLVSGSPVCTVTEHSTQTTLPPRRWSSLPASLPLAGETSHSWNTPLNSAGSRQDQKSTTRLSSSCFDSGKLPSPHGSPRHHGIVLERGGLPVSGKFPVPSRS